MNIQTDEETFDEGYTEGWMAYEPGEPTGDPVAVHDDYQFGWWVGVGDATAWHEGWEAAEKGVIACPYLVGSDDECFREPWHNGYWACFTSMSFKVRGEQQ